MTETEPVLAADPGMEKLVPVILAAMQDAFASPRPVDVSMAAVYVAGKVRLAFWPREETS